MARDTTISSWPWLFPPLPRTHVLQLFRSKDKLLRAMLVSHIVSDIRNMNRYHRNDKVNKAIQAFMYTMLADEDVTAAKKSLDVMITLYKKKVRVCAAVPVVCSSALVCRAVPFVCCSAWCVPCTVVAVLGVSGVGVCAWSRSVCAVGSCLACGFESL
jgi:hypothetical protein